MKYIIVNNKKVGIPKWKYENEKYLFELQKFLDKVTNIKDKKLQEGIIIQMLICDEVLTNASEKHFKQYYGDVNNK